MRIKKTPLIEWKCTARTAGSCFFGKFRRTVVLEELPLPGCCGALQLATTTFMNQLPWLINSTSTIIHHNLLWRSHCHQPYPPTTTWVSTSDSQSCLAATWGDATRPMAHSAATARIARAWLLQLLGVAWCSHPPPNPLGGNFDGSHPTGKSQGQLGS